MKESAKTQSTLLVAGAVVAAAAGTLAGLLGYARQQMQRRGYPSWEECRCDFKLQRIIFQVWHSRHQQRGETIVTQEWGIYLVSPPQWLRQFLHHITQFITAIRPGERYLERVTLSPQESYQLASILHASTTNEDLPELPPEERAYITWRREVLHLPRYAFDTYMRRLYPAHVAPDQFAQAEGLPALWDPASNLPLAIEGTLLDVPAGTRVDCIGWSPSQVSYCTARLEPEEE
ncbi:MAG: hypothetical protein NVS2B12_09090 [Ktedonobacteraceae bacterium]